jgi:hypothetical protein
MGARSLDEVTTIEVAVTRAIAEAELPVSSPIRQALVHDAEVYDITEVCVPDADGKSVSLRQRLAQMRDDPRWKGEFPEKKVQTRPAAPQVAAPGAVLRPDQASFANIAAGKVVVR